MTGMFINLHEQIRAAREAHGLSQQKLAALAGVDRGDIQRLERGDNVTIKMTGQANRATRQANEANR